MKRRTWIAVAAIPLLLAAAALVAALVAAWALLDPAALQARIADAVERATGRTLTIGGPVRIAWSLVPTLSLDRVALANPPGYARPDLVHAERVDVTIALLPLLSRRIEIRRIAVAAPDLRLERDAQGRPNWLLGRPASPATPAEPAPRPASRAFDLQLGPVQLTDAHLAWAGPTPMDLTAPTLAYDPATRAATATLLIHGAAYAADATADPPRLHLAGQGLDATLAGLPPGPITVDATIADLARLTGAQPPLRDARLHAVATLAPPTLTLADLRLTAAQGDLAGALVLGLGQPPTLSGTLSATRLDLDALTSQPAPPTPPQPAPQSGPAPPQQPPRPARLLPDRPIPFDALRRANVDLHLDVADLLWRGRHLHGVQAHLVVQDGRLAADPSLALGPQRLAAHLAADAASQNLALALDGSNLPAADAAALLGPPAGAPVVAGGTLDLAADLHAQGATTAALAATLSGHLGLALVDADIDNSILQPLATLSRLPVDRGRTSLRCAALRADAAAGQITLHTLTIDTAKLKLDGTGTIDLPAETLDLHLAPQLRLGTGLSVPVRVRGTLAAPAIALDPGAIAPGRVGIVIGGPPPEDTCAASLAAARGGRPGAAAPPPAPAKPLKPADLLRGLLR